MTVIASAGTLAEAEWNRLARRGFHLHRWHWVAEACGPHGGCELVQDESLFVALSTLTRRLRDRVA